MIKFIDLKNNYTFDGSSYVKVMKCPKCDNVYKYNYWGQTRTTCEYCGNNLNEIITGPHYTFWFDGEQSTSLYYVKEICVITDDQHGYINHLTGKHMLPISINNNDVFKLINIDHLPKAEDSIYKEYINGFKYYDINSLTNVDNLEVEGERISDQFFIHMIYIVGKSEHNGEFQEDFFIDNIPYRIGADFYDENEALQINLSNFGFDINNDIQKSIYDSNIHEDYSDNILLNRKLKELLINYWNIIANKGSYKSLNNSLNWFEWGDLIKIKELYAHDIGNKIIYNDSNLVSVLKDKYKESLSHFSKTTFISLYTALEQYLKINNKPIYDSELNPILEFISSKWSFNDLSLKMSLLGKFYEEYFMPIHLDLIHSTIEDIVFENTIKINQSAQIHRQDNIYDFSQISTNIKDDDLYYLSYINKPIPKNSISAININNTFDVFEKNDIEESGYYSGPGVVVPISLIFPLESNDFIKSEQISISTKSDEWVTKKYNYIFKNIVDFEFISTEDVFYEIRMQFETANCKVYTYNLKINICEADNFGINLYKYKKKNELKPSDFSAIYIDIDHIDNNYFISKNTSDKVYEYIPINESKKIGNNHVIVLIGNYINYKDDFFNHYYTILYKNKDKEYTICISKDFDFEPKDIPQFLLEVMYNNGYKYFSEFYTMSELKGYNIDNYTIFDDESLCISTNLKFNKYINKYQWIFENVSTGETFYPTMHIYEPFITNENTQILTPGYYNILFKYNLVNGEENVIEINSAFIKK